MTKKIKALRLKKPFGLDNIQVTEMEDPGQPGPGEIRVKVKASSLNFHDYGVASGFIPTEDGRIPMSDGAGVVEAVGEGVEEFAVGDNVVSTFFPYWQSGPAPVGDFHNTPVMALMATLAKLWCVRLSSLPISRRVIVILNQPL
ncbi:alcohol dehydrogenase catalytic domain-containing protein [Pseudoalteromonas shioyasakiensis]|uniref:alcohol dehydrogenase catalytic domain-containing protein n=1 Tax=Pseudoalteromonas shioyasakiensis TaxID=1190813 RepID=UPI0020CFC11D|nr:alcohol dehydrogenase catalytic domain-containing protein [Pseudoalteromonas shioyasakiensis]|tara:strand:+ start:6547 stop:6978 length:432 start_codon:yes stop_codon:yes gene_type:complete